MDYRLRALVKSVKGSYKRADVNEDSTFVDSYDNCRICILSDGMGGVTGGGVASSIVTSSLSKRLSASLPVWEKHASTIEDDLVADLEFVNSTVISNPEASGATVDVLVKLNDKIYVGHTGDSAVVVVNRSGEIRKITEDDTNLNELIKNGMMTEEEKYVIDFKEKIKQYIGKEDCQFSKYVVPLGDVRYVLVYSDGFKDRFTRKILQDRINSKQNMDELMDELFAVVKDPEEKAEWVYNEKKTRNPNERVWKETIKEKLVQDDATLILLEVMEVR